MLVHFSNDLVTLSFLLRFHLSLVLVFLQASIALSNDALDLELSGLLLHTHAAMSGGSVG